MVTLVIVVPVVVNFVVAADEWLVDVSVLVGFVVAVVITLGVVAGSA